MTHAVNEEIACPDPPHINHPSLAGIGAFVGLLIGILVPINVDWSEMDLWAQMLLIVVLVASAIYAVFRFAQWIRRLWRTAKCRFDLHSQLSERLRESQGQAERLRQARNDQNVLIANIGSGTVGVKTTPYQITNPPYRSGKLCFVIPLQERLHWSWALRW